MEDTEELVCDDIKARQAKGVAKYGTTVANNPLARREWLRHAYEECLDMAIYLKRSAQEKENDLAFNKPMRFQFDEYQRAASKTAIYPGNFGSVEALSYCAMGLAGEAGEVAGKVKKVMRDDAGELTEQKRTALAAELGDVLWYVSEMARQLGVRLGDVADANLHKLDDRSRRDVLGGSGDDR